MRFTKKHFTKYERRFGRLLQELRISFRTKVIIKGHEVDFLIREKNIIEIDGHIQNTDKNKVLIEAGYNVFHFQNSELNDKEKIKIWLKHLWVG